MTEFKTTEVGLIPLNWDVVKITDFAQTKSGGTPSTSKQEYWNGDVPWINSGALNNCTIKTPTKYITKCGLENSAAKLLPKNAVVIALTGATTGKVGLLDFECSTNQSVVGILPNESFNSAFLFYALINSRQRVLSFKSGAAQPHINKGVVDNFLVVFPSIPEQQNIAHILAKIQSAMETQEKIIQTITELKKALMQKLFTEGLKGEPQKETEIGLVPKSWEVKRIGEVYDFTHKPRGLDLRKIKEVPFIPMELIPDDNLVVKDFELRKTEDLSSGTYIEKGDLLIAKITPSFENGKQAIVDFEHQFGFATTEVIPIKERQNISCKQYLFYYLLKSNIRGLLAGKMEGSTGRQRLSKAVLQETLIPFPSYKEHVEIADTFIKIDDKVQFVKTKKVILTELFNSMLHHLMTGQIRVKDLKVS